MGNYNPDAPFVLGNEWVGIRDEDTQFSPLVHVVEQGTTFTTTQAYTLKDGRFYVNDIPANTGDAVYLINLYPQGTEDLSGPVKRLVIPTESAFVTGATISSGSALQALLTPYLGNYIILDSTVVNSMLVMGFNTAPYTILDGKRILAVNFLYAAHRFFGTDDRDNGPYTYFTDSTAPTSGIQYSAGNDIPEGGETGNDQVLITRLGEVNRLWQSPTTFEVLPWNFADLQRFDSSTAGTKLYVTMYMSSSQGLPTGAYCLIWYGALEVLYCEEQRIIVGGNRRASSSNELNYGANPVTLRSIARVVNPSLAAGNWTATVSTADAGDLAAFVKGGYPDLNALRELYQIPGLAGVQLNLTQTEGDQFEAVQTHVLTQLSIHTSGAALTEVHGYGRQYPAQVYGSVQAIQEIRDDLVGGSASFPQVRFYARHFNGTTQPLTISGASTLSGSAASITVADFDVLEEIMDGWKEVTLRLDVAPTMGALTPDPQWVFLSPSEVAGSRWEVLAVQAPAVSGIPGDLLQLVNPSGQRLGPTTYQPPVGDTVELSTLSMYASGGIATQNDVDACMIFSQDPYTVTGFALQLLSQTVTGIGQGCNGDPCCIPTAISYARLTWPALSMSVSGFGAFELQRLDSLSGWQTIMSASNTGVTGFNDYEARVGVASVYRIRVLNLYRFAGAWSDQVTGTVVTPGITISCAGNITSPAGVLIFTSNSVQSGSSNLAYVEQFDRSVEEAFTFVEAGTQQLRRQYRRDYQVAYRPTERGGEAFSRVLLVQGAAGALPNMANMTSLRNLAWADLPYVCVRDELGNRWLANVNVPGGTIAQRSLYLATVGITEVTATPTEVDP